MLYVCILHKIQSFVAGAADKITTIVDTSERAKGREIPSTASRIGEFTSSSPGSTYCMCEGKVHTKSLGTSRGYESSARKPSQKNAWAGVSIPMLVAHHHGPHGTPSLGKSLNPTPMQPRGHSNPNRATSQPHPARFSRHRFNWALVCNRMAACSRLRGPS